MAENPWAGVGADIKRDLPDRAPASSWRGKHPKERTRRVAHARWMCLDCVREARRPAEP
ncbi:hypothetical protein [Streptomyces sp. NPDC058989]|uniref:hypothetical protein n=1 Tax=Streptomyces sp. NPDC058989 TaxID=3346686 RepID=UPI0036A942A8